MPSAWVAAVAGPLIAGVMFRVLWKRRRRRLAWTGLALFAVPYLLGVWAFIVEPNSLVVRHVTVASPQWRGPPVRIGVISDTHVGGPFVSVERMARIVERMNAEKPDVVVLLGDYAAGHEPAAMRADPERSVVQRGIATFRGLKAPLGVYAIIGNHDAWYDEPAVTAALRRAGAVVLANDAAPVPRPGGVFWVAGLEDLESTVKRSSVKTSLAKVPTAAPVIFLTHFPDPWPRVPDRVALTLAGHTHCGQVNFPFVGRLVHASRGSARWPCGLYRDGERRLYVSGGIGVSILPVRFRAPPEITIVRLRPA
jgi:predicted MPP superfamily phosphohydrolase